jgi:hypothetical protein
MMLTRMEAVNVRAHAESGNKPNATAVQNLAIFKFSVVYYLSLTTTKIILYHFQLLKHLSSHFFELKVKMPLKFEVLFFTILRCRKHHVPQRKSSFPKRGNTCTIIVPPRNKNCVLFSIFDSKYTARNQDPPTRILYTFFKYLFIYFTIS